MTKEEIQQKIEYFEDALIVAAFHGTSTEMFVNSLKDLYEKMKGIN
jgi:hypothetical protein